MKQSGIIHAELAAGLAGLRHTDTLLTADAGLPVPAGPHLLDLGVTYGCPPFLTVLQAVLAELVIDAATAAVELPERNRAQWEAVRDLLPNTALIPHEELKAASAASRLVVRTGEATPFSNVILTCGVPF